MKQGHTFLHQHQLEILTITIMKALYYKQSGIIYFVVLAALLAGCSQSLTYNDAMNKNEKKINDVERMEDARFLVDAKSFNLLEAGLTEAAMNSGYSASVVELGKQNHESHLALNKELDQLARKEKIIVPATMDDRHQAMLFEVSKSDRKDFDKTFVRVYKMANEENSSKYMKMATDAKDEDIRAFAARKLDMFKTTMTQLEAVDQELLKTY